MPSRRRNLLLALLLLHVLGNVGWVLVAYYLPDLASQVPGLYSALYGITAAQPVLAAMWATLARQSLPARAVLPLASLALITFATMLALVYVRPVMTWDSSTIYFGYQAALFFLAAAITLIMRGVLNWQIAPREALEAAVAERSGAKLRLTDLFAATALAAGGLAALRGYRQYTTAALWPLTMDCLHAAVALTLVPLCLAATRSRRDIRWACAGLALDLAISTALILIGGVLTRHFLPAWLGMAVGFFGTIAVSLAIVRAAGYRLVRPRNVGVTTVASIEPQGGKR